LLVLTFFTITYIAFIECVLKDNPRKWETIYGFPQINNPTTHAVYKARRSGAEIGLVDINQTRRYFSFQRDGELHIINNVVVFDSKWAEELALDDSKKLLNKKRIDE